MHGKIYLGIVKRFLKASVWEISGGYPSKIFKWALRGFVEEFDRGFMWKFRKKSNKKCAMETLEDFSKYYLLIWRYELFLRDSLR